MRAWLMNYTWKSKFIDSFLRESEIELRTLSKVDLLDAPCTTVALDEFGMTLGIKLWESAMEALKIPNGETDDVYSSLNVVMAIDLERVHESVWELYYSPLGRGEMKDGNLYTSWGRREMKPNDSSCYNTNNRYMDCKATRSNLWALILN